MSKFVLLTLVIVLQVCMAIADVSDDANESQGVLEKAKEVYKDLRARVVDAGSTTYEFIHMYYEDHVKPVTDKYTEWAQENARSFWDAVKDKISIDESG